MFQVIERSEDADKALSEKAIFSFPLGGATASALNGVPVNAAATRDALARSQGVSVKAMVFVAREGTEFDAASVAYIRTRKVSVYGTGFSRDRTAARFDTAGAAPETRQLFGVGGPLKLLSAGERSRWRAERSGASVAVDRDLLKMRTERAVTFLSDAFAASQTMFYFNRAERSCHRAQTNGGGVFRGRAKAEFELALTTRRFGAAAAEAEVRFSSRRTTVNNRPISRSDIAALERCGVYRFVHTFPVESAVITGTSATPTAWVLRSERQCVAHEIFIGCNPRCIERIPRGVGGVVALSRDALKEALRAENLSCAWRD